MNRVCGVAIIVYLMFPSLGFAQPIKLESWTTTEGKTAEAAFQDLNNDTNVVTILVPKKIPLYRLDEDSRKLAIDLRRKADKAASETKVDPKPPKVYSPIETRFLITVADWKSATEADKLFTAKEWMFIFFRKRIASDSLIEKVTNLNALEHAARELAGYCDDTVASGSFSDTQVLAEWLALFITTAGWGRNATDVKEPTPEPSKELDQTTRSNEVAVAASTGDLDYAFFRQGNDDLNVNSATFNVTEPAVYFVGMKVKGASPFASLSVGSTPNSKYIGGQISADDFGEKDVVFGCNVLMSNGRGEAFARVSTQNCEWLFAVVNVSKVPSESELSIMGRSVLRKAGWSPIPLSR